MRLNLLFGALQLVVGDELILVALFDDFEGVAAGVTHANFTFFGHLRGALGEFKAAFAGERGNRAAHEVALRDGVDADVGGHDGLADIIHHALIEGLDHDCLRVGRGDGGHVLQALRHAVGFDVDLDVLDHARRSLAGVQRGEFVRGVVDRLLHGVAAVGDEFFEVHGIGWGYGLLLENQATSVPIRWPRTAFFTAPFSDIESTMIGSLLASQSENASASITPRRFWRASAWETRS